MNICLLSDDDLELLYTLSEIDLLWYLSDKVSNLFVNFKLFVK
jgi:hypothetical protein